MKDFREKASSSLIWSVINQVSSQSALLVMNVVLARLLTPRDFGLVATAMIFVNFAMILNEGGFGMAAIQKPDVTEEHLSSIFWLNVCVGLTLTTTFMLGAPLIARFYGEPDLTSLMRLVSVIFTIHAFGSTHSMLVARRLEFRTLAKSGVASAWCGAAAALWLASRGWGPWSIAGQSVVSAVVGASGIAYLSGWRPRFVFRWSALGELAGLSGKHVFSNMAGYWVRSVDNVLVGYQLGQAPLGVYTRAYSVMLFPWTRVTQVISRVMFPSFSIIQNDHPRLRALFERVTRVIALATFPMMLGVMASAENFVAVVFGPQWGEMVPILRILAVVGMLNSISSLFYEVFLSQNRMDLYLRVSLPVQATQVLGIVVGLKWGIVGVAYGYALTTVLTTPVMCRVGGGIIGMSLGRFAANLAPLFSCAAVMALAVVGVDAVLPAGTGAPARLALQVLAGAAVYGGLLHAFSVQGYVEFVDEARARLARTPA